MAPKRHGIKQITAIGQEQVGRFGHRAQSRAMRKWDIRENGTYLFSLDLFSLARFLSPDPLVVAPYFSQAYNRYSYV